MIDEALKIGSFVLRHPIGRRRPVRCAFDVLRWQLTASPNPVAMPFVGDARLWARRGETGVTGNIYVGLHEFEDMAFVAHALRPADRFLDVGANAGSYTVLAAKVAGAEVIAVEPVPETAARLRANLELNGISDRVRVVEAAVGAEPGETWFAAGHDTTNHVVEAAEAGSGCIRVAVETIDRLSRARSPAVAKIDVEGYEAAALAGAVETLASAGLLALVVEIDGGAGEADGAAGRLRAAGFRPMRYDPWSRTLAGEERARSTRGNGLFVRDATTLEERLRSAPPILVKGLRI